MNVDHVHVDVQTFVETVQRLAPAYTQKRARLAEMPKTARRGEGGQHSEPGSKLHNDSEAGLEMKILLKNRNRQDQQQLKDSQNRLAGAVSLDGGIRGRRAPSLAGFAGSS